MDKAIEIMYIGVLPPHGGGAAIASAQVLEGLAERGHKIRALCPMPENLSGAEDVYATAHPEIAVTRYIVPHAGLNPLVPFPDDYRNHEDKKIREALPGLIQDSRPDIIIVGRESFVWHVPQVAQSYSIPNVLVCHGGTLIGIQQGTHSAELERQFFQGLDMVSFIITVAQHLRDFLRPRGYNNIKAIPNGVDARFFYPTPKDPLVRGNLDARPDDVVVLFPGMLKSQKRPLDLVASAALALQRNPNLLFVIAGTGPMASEMEEACRQAGVSDRFRFVGWVEHSKMPRYYNTAEMVVLPSEGEGLALAYLEAQSCGSLLIASDIAPAREAVMDGQTGLLFRKGDVEQLAEKMVFAANSPDQCRQIGLAARERVLLRPIETVVTEYEEVFANVASAPFGDV